MSEKRFTFYYERGNEVVIEDNGKRLSNKKVVDLLNEQQATITAQKKGLDEYMDNIIALSKENEQLKQEVFVYKKAFQEQVQRCSL